MQKVLLRSLGTLAVLALVFSSPLAHADSVTYDLTGSFSTGTSLSGWVNWTGSGISAYSLSLSNSTDTAQCSSSIFRDCALAGGRFSTSQGPEVLAGLLNPFGPSLLALTTFNGPFQLPQFYTVQDVSWNVAMPEGSEVLMLILAMLVLGFAMYRSPKFRPQLQV